MGGRCAGTDSFVRNSFYRSDTVVADSDDEDGQLVVDDQESMQSWSCTPTPFPCITISEDEASTQHPIQIRVAVPGEIILGVCFFYLHWTLHRGER